jgi:hypothetical protein
MVDQKPSRRDLLRLAALGVAGGASFGSIALADAPSVFDVRSFGAVGNGREVDSPAVNKAIEAAAEAGGRGGSQAAGPEVARRGLAHWRIDEQITNKSLIAGLLLCSPP